LFYCKFPGECDSERILKIGQYLTKLYVDYVGLLFWPTLYIEDRPTTDRPLKALMGKISNGHISARGRPIHFMFGSTVGFSGSADRMALFPV